MCVCDVRWRCAVLCDALFVPVALLHQQSKTSSTAIAGEQQPTGSGAAVQRYVRTYTRTVLLSQVLIGLADFTSQKV